MDTQTTEFIEYASGIMNASINYAEAWGDDNRYAVQFLEELRGIRKALEYAERLDMWDAFIEEYKKTIYGLKYPYYVERI